MLPVLGPVAEVRDQLLPTGNRFVKLFDRFLGLFSSKAAVEEAEHVPILRDKLRQLLQQDHLLPGSHDYKEMVAAFNSLPKEELFRASLGELRQELDAIIGSFGDTDVQVTMLPDAQRKNDPPIPEYLKNYKR